MSAAQGMTTIGFLGGTGPEGRGLALRLGLAGHRVLLGSRDADRASDAARGLAEEHGVDATGDTNDAVAKAAGVVFLVMPYEGLAPTLEAVGPSLSDKLVVCCVNRLGFEGGPHAVAVDAGSSAQEAAALVPDARMVGAFHTVSAAKMLDPSVALEGDVPVCGDDEDAREEVVALADATGLRGVHAGKLYQSGTMEAVCALLIAVNKRYKTSTGITITNLPER